jgi:hypothetical protein
LKVPAFFIPFLIAVPLYAQEQPEAVSFGDSLNFQKRNTTLTGIVTNAETNEPVQGVNIFADGLYSGQETDANGKYFLSLPAGEYRIVFRHAAMIPKVFKVGLYAHGLLNVKMSPKVVDLSEIIISARGAEQNIKHATTGIVEMSIEQVKTLPALMGETDVIKSLQLFPGVTSVGEGSSGVNIRGGRSDQNLTLMNEALVLSSNHAMGFLSSFNHDVVGNFTLYKGNVPSYYGGRASATLNIEMKKGNFDKWNMQGGIGTSSNRLLIDGPLLKDRVSIISGARFSNANWILRKAENSDVSSSSVRFYDFYGAVTARIGAKHVITVNGLHTGDHFKFSDKFGYEWSSDVASVNSKNSITEKLSAYSILAYGDFRNSFFDPSGPEAARITNGVTYVQGKFSLLYALEKHSITAGTEAIRYQAAPEKMEAYGGSPVIPARVGKNKGLEYSFYAEDEWSPVDALSFSFGIRASFYRQLGPDSVYFYQEGAARSEQTITGKALDSSNALTTQSGLEPRFSGRVNLTPTRSLKFSYSRMMQYLHTISNTLAPTPIDLWQVSTRYLKPQRSQMYSLGYFQNFREEAWSGSIELFYRKSADQVEYRDFAKLFMNPHIETELLQGEGRSYGSEFFLKKNIGNWTGWLSYTYSRSVVKIDGATSEEQVNEGKWFPSNHDRPHVTSLVLNRKFYPRGSFNVSFTHSTGRPISAVVSNYTVNHVSVPNYSYRNEYRIPNYFRMDVSCVIGNVIRKIDDSLTISIYNLLSRRNAYSVYFQKSGSSFIMIPYKLSVLGTIFPSMTYTISLKR